MKLKNNKIKRRPGTGPAAPGQAQKRNAEAEEILMENQDCAIYLIISRNRHKMEGGTT